MPASPSETDFLRYLAAYRNGEDDPERLPALEEISGQLGVGISKLREQLEVARALGLVEVRPRAGIRRKPYTFTAAVQQSLLYAVTLDWQYFEAFAELRRQVEQAFWPQAVAALTPEDHAGLRQLVDQASEKLNGPRIIIPHQEHKALHLLIFSRVQNPFVQGLVEAYWAAYEAVGLNQYADINYLREVWAYHRRIVDAICAGDTAASYQAFVDHIDLIHHRPE